jgi:hypothetical protein
MFIYSCSIITCSINFDLFVNRSIDFFVNRSTDFFVNRGIDFFVNRDDFVNRGIDFFVNRDFIVIRGTGIYRIYKNLLGYRYIPSLDLFSPLFVDNLPFPPADVRKPYIR